MKDSDNTLKVNRTLTLAFIPLAVGINLGIGTLVQVLKLPVFLDSIGTIIAAVLLGWRVGAIVGVVGFIITSITIFPPAVYFSFTQICIAVFVYFTGKQGWFKNLFRTTLSGMALAIVAGLVSAPVIYYLFGGITGNGISAFTIYLQVVGFTKGQSVVISGLSAEVIDKTAQCLIAFSILKSIPKFLLSKFQGGCLIENDFI
ncbi:MAG: hypothetical protein WCO44_03455 [Bacteroidota bacterium]